MKRACEACTHWEQKTYTQDQTNIGLCRLNPPILREGTDEQYWSWPVTNDEDWCGSYKSSLED